MTKENRDKLDIAAYIRGDISAEDEAVFEALIREDTDFAAEVAFQKTLRETLRSDAPPKQDTAFGWARLSKAIDEETPSSALPVPANDRGPRVKVWR
jgi:anti-sigma factor RsiW